MAMKALQRTFGVLALAISAQAAAQTVSWEQEWGTRIKNRESSTVITSDSFGEQVNLYDGSTSFAATDIDIPGTDALPVKLARHLTIGLPSNVIEQELFGDWELELPHLQMIADSTSTTPSWTGTCSSGGINSEMQLAGTSGNGPLLNRRADQKAPSPTGMVLTAAKTRSGWYFQCTPMVSGQTGDGFIGVAPDGTRWTFNTVAIYDYPARYLPGTVQGTQTPVPRVQYRLYPTSAADRFGNVVQYQWSGRKLLSVTSTDARQITFTYVPQTDRIATASAHGKTWSYAYNAKRLATVTQPDSSAWTYSNLTSPYVDYKEQYERINCRGDGSGHIICDYQLVLDQTVACAWAQPINPVTYSLAVTSPAGASATFYFQAKRQGRTNVPRQCEQKNGAEDTNSQRDRYNVYQPYHDAYALTSKQVTGTGVGTLNWNYSYAGLESGYQATTYSPQYRSTTVVQPDTAQQIYVYGKDWGVNDGQLARTETRKAGVLVRSVDNAYVTSTEVPSMLFDAAAGDYLVAEPGADLWGPTAIRPLKSSSTYQGGDTFTREISTFDSLARPTRIARYSSLGYGRADQPEYFDHYGYWVLGQTKKQYNEQTGIVELLVDYDAATALPTKYTKAGKVVQSLTYNADGTIATVKDGRDNSTALSGWKRGIPQRIDHPDGTFETAVVGDLGWIDSTTDEVGFTTAYQYDGMGRLSRVTYPVGDTPGWADKVATFAPLTSGDTMPQGVVAGQWRHLISQGNYRKATYFDGLWRPVLVHEYDATNMAGTLRSSSTSYDTSGQLSFQSYPSNAQVPASSGTWTTYDALGRLTRVEQDSEKGRLVTGTEYLGGLQVRVTNPRNVATTNSFMAWDQPSYDLLVKSVMPENAVTEITRNALGMPLELKRRSADNALSVSRRYVYNPALELCKTIEPESGATINEYDAAGNLLWSASGLTAPDQNDCSTSIALASGRAVSRVYDARNRVAEVNFPDSNGSQRYTYELDGLPKTVRTYNEGGTSSVLNSYTYNRRRMLAGESQQQDIYTWAVGYGYDNIGNRSTMTYPGNLSVAFNPDALGQARLVTGSGTTYASNIQYFANGALRSFTYGNGIQHEMQQNDRQLPAVVKDTLPGGAYIDGGTLAYDKNGNVEQYTSYLDPVGRARSMTYDGLDRLVTAYSPLFGGTDSTHRFSYDALDNIKSWKLAGKKDYADYYYNPANNRLENIRNSSNASIVGLGYDPQGNMTQKNAQSFFFDYGNRMRTALTTESYQYDAHGRRILTKSSGVKSFALYGAEGPLLWERDERANARLEYVYLSGRLVVARRREIGTTNDQLLYYHTDLLGSPTAITGSTGAVVQRSDYDPFGGLINRPIDNRPEFGGHVVDAPTSFGYMQQRYFDPSIGRFVSIDPESPTPTNAITFNRYAYAANNPLTLVDPDGRNPAAGAAIGCAVSGPACPGGAVVGALVGGAIALGTYCTARYLYRQSQMSEASDEGSGNSKKPPSGSKPIDKTDWSGDHGGIKGQVGAAPDDKVFISPDGEVWVENPDGTWTNHGPAEDYTGSGEASGRRGKDRDRDRDARRDRDRERQQQDANERIRNQRWRH